MTWVLEVACLWAYASLSSAQAPTYFENYDMKAKPGVVSLAVQPMAYPLAFISSTMQRDRLLHQELKQQGLTLRVFNFKKGNDIVQVATPDSFGMAFLGDMPTVNLSMKFPIAIAGLGKRNFSTVVARNFTRLEELKGHKIGYSAGSSSHLVLMRGLKAGNMSIQDVSLVPMEPADMPDALEAGTIDAFSAWEPTPSISLARSPKNRAVYKGMSTDWVVMPRELTTKHPRVAMTLMASYVRSINWMRRAKANVEQAASWVLADGNSFTALPSRLALDKAVEIAYKDLLNVPGAPSIPSLLDGVSPLVREFTFLKELGTLPGNTDVEVLRAAFNYGGLKTIQADPKGYRLFVFDYDR
jgi:ABC-type nitrate/sulfonate/bicarbonate transport system substrate-binding protein